MDYRFSPELTAGFGIGYGRDVTDFGSNGTESRAEAFFVALYGIYRLGPGFFLDGLTGYNAMSFDSTCFAPLPEISPPAHATATSFSPRWRRATNIAIRLC